MGMLGCLLCIVGSTVIVLHAPEEQSINSVEQIWELAIQPGILLVFPKRNIKNTTKKMGELLNCFFSCFWLST